MTALFLLSLSASAAPFRYAEDQAPGIVNPLFSTTMSEARVNELLFDSLYSDNQDLATVPKLVRSDELSSDGLSLTLRLREDVSWHDGRPLNAQDVAFTIAAMKDPGTISTEAGRVAWIDSVQVQNDTTLVLGFAEPQLRPQDKLTFKILPAHHFSGAQVSRSDTFKTRPVGTGPYKLVSYNDDNSITFQADPDNREGQARLGEIVMREVSDKSYQAKLLLYESLEALVRVLPRDLAVLQNNRKIELYPYQTNSWWYVGFNTQRAPFDDVRVRQAMDFLVDVDALLAPIGTGEVLSGPFVRSSPFYNHEVRARGYNDARAAALLEDAGYMREGGMWSKDGQELTLTLSAHRTLESAQEVVINLQSQLRAGGVQVEVEFLDEPEWKARVWREQDYDLVLSQWSFDRNEDIREQLHSQGARNFSGYKNPEVDRLLDEARSARDPHAKKSALRQVHALAQQDCPMLFLWTLDSYSAVTTRAQDVVIHPFYFFTWVRQWHLRP